MQNWEVIYQYQPVQQASKKEGKPFHKYLAMGIIAISVGGFVGPLTPAIRLETGYWRQRIIASVRQSKTDATTRPLPASVTGHFLTHLSRKTAHRSTRLIRNLVLIVPKVGINAPVLAGVNPC